MPLVTNSPINTYNAHYAPQTSTVTPNAAQQFSNELTASNNETDHSLKRFDNGRFGTWQMILEATGFNYQERAAALESETPPRALVLAAPSDNAMKEWLVSVGIATSSDLAVMSDEQVFELVNDVFGQEGLENIVKQNVFAVDQTTYQNFASHLENGGQFVADSPEVSTLLSSMVRTETKTESNPGYRLMGDQIVDDASIDNTTVRPDGASAENNIAVIAVKLPLLKEDEVHRANGYGVAQTALNDAPAYFNNSGFTGDVPHAPETESSHVPAEEVRARPNINVQDILSEQRFSIWSQLAGDTVSQVLANNPDKKVVVGAMTNSQMKDALVQNGLVTQTEANGMNDADVFDAWSRITGDGPERQWLIQRNIFFITDDKPQGELDYQRVLNKAENDKPVNVVKLLDASDPFNASRGYVNTSLDDNQVYLKHKDWGRGIVSTNSLTVAGNGMVVTMDSPIQPDRIVWRMEGWREARSDMQRTS